MSEGHRPLQFPARRIKAILMSFLYSANSRYAKVNPISMETTPHQTHGRPRKVIDSDWLEDALSPRRKITFKRLAVALGMHRNTLQRHLKKHNVHQRFSAIRNADLDILVKTFKIHKPDSGLRYLVGFLRSHSVRVPRHRMRSSMHRVDVVGQMLRRRKVIQRRKYAVPRSNHLWHLDGHHKLILWGISMDLSTGIVERNVIFFILLIC